MFTTPLVAISLYEMANNGNGFINVAVLVAVVMAAVNVDRLQPVIQHNSELTGAKYFAEIMDTENVHCFRSVARMDKETFMKLNDLLRDVGGLENFMYLCTGQMAMIYIQVFRGYTVRIICVRWQHSSDTISKIVHNVSDA